MILQSGIHLPLWLTRLVANPGFQRFAAQIPFGRRLVRREGRKIFDILQGFVASQVLAALVELNVLRTLMDGPASAAQLGLSAGLAADRMDRLLRAGAALGLLRIGRDERYALTQVGAAILGAPGLEAMILHNRALYQDMSDPVALLRDGDDTHLQRFWPYVMATNDARDDVAGRYSDLMAQSQVMVAQDTLRMVSFRGTRRLLDIGGGLGAFVTEVLRRYPGITADVFDLPAVAEEARARIQASDLRDRIRPTGGNFLTDALPVGADTVSLVRVLYDHRDDTVTQLLARVYAALPPGGRLVISEPMSGGRRPDPACDVYFAFYTMAMGTGTVRTPERIAGLCRAAGFGDVRIPNPPRAFITSVVECRKPK